MKRQNLLFGDDLVVRGTFEKFHTQNVEFTADTSLQLVSKQRENSLELGQQDETKVHNMVADKFRGRSDKRLKSNIKPLPDNAPDLVYEMQPKQYTFKNDLSEHYGMIAQEMREILPNVVSEDGSGYLTISYIELVPFLVQTVKSLNDRVRVLEKTCLRMPHNDDDDE